MSIVQGPRLNRLADLNVLKLDLGQENGPGEQVLFGGMLAQHCLYLQQVSGDLTNADPIELRVVGANPGRSLSGAQWAFNGTVYCAYNDGTSGAIQIRLNETFFDTPRTGTIFAARVKGSAETASNDGLNCLNAASPFPPQPRPALQPLQPSFVFWHFSRVEAEKLKSKKLLKKVSVDFKIYTHYSGHSSYTSRR